MPTITASPGLVYAATNACTGFLGTSNTTDFKSSFFSATGTVGFNFQGSPTPGGEFSTMLFKNSVGDTLISTTIGNFTRTMAANGYVVLNNFTPVTPVANGTIAYIEIANWIGGVSTNPTNYYFWTLVVGGIGSGADIEIDDRDVTTNQPWRLDGSIRFRVPSSYTYSL
jgi:hypothetical protein